MLKKNFKRLVAMLLSATMVIGSSTAAFAGTIGEAGDVEGWVNKKVFSVLVPTASANALKMLVDPQKLIASTNAVAKEGYTAADFANATILFPRLDEGANVKKFDSRSDTISMANVGTVSVNVSLTAAITGADGIALSANASPASMGATTDPTMYIEMAKEDLGNIAANGTAWNTAKAGGTPNTADAILLSGNNGSASKSVDLSIDKVAGVISNYVVSHNGTNYTYGVSSDKVDAVKSAAYATGQCIKFYFTGATNNGDNIGWKSLVNAKPNLTLTYNITKADTDAEEQALAGEANTNSPEPTVAGARATAEGDAPTVRYTSGQALRIPVGLGTGDTAATGVNRITYINSSGVSTALGSDNWSYAGGYITIAEGYITALANANVTRNYKVTFEGESGTESKLWVKLAP